MDQTPSVTESSPSHFVRHFRRSVKFIILTTVVGALIGIALSQFLHPRWLARMTIQIGQVSSPGMASQLIENQLSASDRYNLAESRLLVLKQLGLQAPEYGNKESLIIFDTLRASPAKGPDLIELQVSSYSREQARAALLASFNVFSDEHQKKFEPAVEEMKRELENASTRLATAERDSDRTYDSIRSDNSQAGTASASARDVLLTSTATSINQQLLALANQTTQLRESLAPLRTYPTRIVGAVYVPERPSTPSKSLLIAAGAALGLLTGAAFSALRNSRRA
jgi:uncharacterized protein involved in exopolysaccharide biosynthesis